MNIKNLNELQKEAVKKISRLAKSSHFIDLRFRNNGKWEFVEVDFLRKFLSNLDKTNMKKIKQLVYKTLLPIFLWSIGMDSIYQYTESLTEKEIKFKNAHIKELQEKIKKYQSQLQKLQTCGN